MTQKNLIAEILALHVKNNTIKRITPTHHKLTLINSSLSYIFNLAYESFVDGCNLTCSYNRHTAQALHLAIR